MSKDIKKLEYKVHVYWDEELTKCVAVSEEFPELEGYGEDEDEAINDLARKIAGENTEEDTEVLY